MMVNKNKIGILKQICIYNHTCVCISVLSIYTGILALKARLVEVDQMTYFSSILLTLSSILLTLNLDQAVLTASRTFIYV